MNKLLAAADRLPIDVLPIGTAYPPDTLLARHEHRRAQLLYGAKGFMRVETDAGTWIVPADRAVLIPPRTPHAVLMDDVVTWSLYIEPHAVPWWPQDCMVVEVSPLLRELLREANRLPHDSAATGRDGALIALILHELQSLTPLPFELTVPSEEPFRALCLAYLAEPRVEVTNAAWAQAASMSTRTFDRRFRAAVGVAPAAWRTRARLLSALPELGKRSVTEISAELGYDSSAAFTAAFTRLLGVPPTSFR